MHVEKHYEEDSAENSFLDVVANVVGVLIILVMLVGVRVAHPVLIESANQENDSKPEAETLADPRGDDRVQLQQTLSEAKRRINRTRSEIQQLQGHVQSLALEVEDQDSQRVELAMHRSVLEEDLEHRRSQLDEATQRQFDVQRELVEYRLQLQELDDKKLARLSAPESVEEIESMPTPRVVASDDQPIHIRISQGRVSTVPFYALIEEAQNSMGYIRDQLQSSRDDRVHDVFGPIEGYRLKFTVVHSTSVGAVTGPRAGEFRRAEYLPMFTFIPIDEQIGEDAERALLDGSELCQYLHQSRRRTKVLVAWLYQDSFEDFRKIKKYAWELGYSIDTRVLEAGQHISAAPFGSKTAAQ